MPSRVSRAVLRIEGAGEGDADKTATLSMLAKFIAQPGRTALSDVSLPITASKLQQIVSDFAGLESPWKLFIVAHGTADGRSAAGRTGEQLAMTIHLLLGMMQKPELLEIELLVCYGALLQNGTGLAGSFTQRLDTHGHDVLVIAYPHRISLNTEAQVINPTGVTIFSTATPAVQRWEFDVDHGALRAEQAD